MCAGWNGIPNDLPTPAVSTLVSGYAPAMSVGINVSVSEAEKKTERIISYWPSGPWGWHPAWTPWTSLYRSR